MAGLRQARQSTFCSAAGQNDVRHNASAEIGICKVVSLTHPRNLGR